MRRYVIGLPGGGYVRDFGTGRETDRVQKVLDGYFHELLSPPGGG